jgi:hypothetical protein
MSLRSRFDLAEMLLSVLRENGIIEPSAMRSFLSFVTNLTYQLEESAADAPSAALLSAPLQQ